MKKRLVSQLLNLGLAFCAAIGLGTIAHAQSDAFGPTVEKRSAVKPGLWWDPTKGGHGFDVYPLGSQLFVVWYTYDVEGRAIWYTAQAPMTQPQVGKSSVVVEAQLMKHRWDVANNRALAPTTEGTVSFTLNTAAQITFKYQLNGRSGSWNLQPYQPSGATPDRDYSGLWWNPAKSGYAWSLTQLHDFTYAVMYAYRQNGEPVWMASTFVNPDAVTTGFTQPLSEYRGYCAGCLAQPITSTATSTLQVSYPSANQVSFETNATTLAGGFANSPQLISFSSASRHDDIQLARFTSEANFQRYWAKGMANPYSATPVGVVLPSPAPPSTTTTEASVSAVNTQEANVDEPAQLRTDGTKVFALGVYAKPFVRRGQILGSNFVAQPELFLAEGIRATDIATGSATPWPMSWNSSAGGLYLHQNQLISVLTSYSNCGYFGGISLWPYPCGFTGTKTAVEIFDAETLRREYVAEFEGSLISSRRVGDQVYLVTRVARNFSRIHIPLNRSGLTT
jgi:hypothetical protein